MTRKKREISNKKRRNLIPGIVILCILIGALTVWFQNTSRLSSTGASPYATIHINVPLTKYPTIPPSAPAFTVPIHSIGPSGVTGKVTFEDIAGSVAILLHVDGLPNDEESEESVVPVELHRGPCTTPGTLAYTLTVPDSGESETDLSIDLKEFNTQRPLAVIMYRSVQDRTMIACGDIP